MSGSKLRRVGILCAKISVPIVLILALGHVVEVDRVINNFLLITRFTWFMAAGCLAVTLILNGARWFVLLRALRFPQRLMPAIQIRLIGQAFNMVLPGGVVGDAIQILFVSRRVKMSGTRAFATIAADRIVGLLAIICGILLTTPVLLSNWKGGSGIWLAMVVGALAIVLVCLMVLMWRPSPDQPSNAVGKLVGVFASVLRSILAYRRRPFAVFSAFVIAIPGFLLTSAAVWIIARDLGEIGYLFTIPIVGLATIITLVPLTVSGLGIREWFLAAALLPLGFQLEEIVAISLVWFTLAIGTAATLALAAMTLSPFDNVRGFLTGSRPDFGSVRSSRNNIA